MKTLNDMKIRSQVDETLREMVADVEIANRLEERLVAHSLVARLEERIQQQEDVILEVRMVEEQKNASQALLADNLVRELWSLSRELGELQAMKDNHEALVLEHDEVLAKLFQTEEDLREARLLRTQQPALEREETGGDAGDDRQELSLLAVHEANEGQSELRSQTPPRNVSEITAVEDTKEPEIEEPSAAVVVLDEEDEPGVQKLDEFDAPILMHIFAFLNALDILNTAQINISMYSRVDSLFGLGQDVPVARPPVTAAFTTAAPTSKPTSTATTQQTTAPVKSASSKPVPASKPAAQPVAATATTPSKPTSTSPLQGPSPNKLDSARGLLSSILQPRKPPAGRIGTISSVAHRRVSSVDNPQPMNAAMANSMAAKLSDAELNAIILMTERLKQKEALAEKLVKENEELLAKADGAEAIKEFLVAKMRDMEQSLSTSEDNEAKVARQIASDQEVIAFLDGRVQELEGDAARLVKERDDAINELTRVKEQTEQKAIVMGDMLQFEREQLKENEKEWRATKKLLVKEIKNCRAQIVALQAERDGYREQNELLRRAVMSSPFASNGGMNRDSFYT